MSRPDKQIIRGFPESEFQTRLAKVQRLMENGDVGCVLLTTEAEIYYFTGFLTQFWQSPTRPWYVILPSSGNPIAVIPSIGEELMSSCFVSKIKTWASPDGRDDGLQLLIKTLEECINGVEKIGMMLGKETSMRMPTNDIMSLFSHFGKSKLVDVTKGIQYLRMIKSPREVEKIKFVCTKVSNIFEKLSTFLVVGLPLREIFKEFKLSCLSDGLDDVSYLVGAAGAGGYCDIIAPPGDQKLKRGDVLMLDTGTKWDGYYCDFDRNYGIGEVSDEASKVHEILYESISLVAKEIKPYKVTMKDIYQSFNISLEESNCHKKIKSGSVGRFGHGVGIQLTEKPSIISWDQTPAEPGMVLTLEPSLVYGPENCLMVAEENILITEDGVEFLTKRWPRSLPLV